MEKKPLVLKLLVLLPFRSDKICWVESGFKKLHAKKRKKEKGIFNIKKAIRHRKQNPTFRKFTRSQ